MKNFLLTLGLLSFSAVAADIQLATTASPLLRQSVGEALSLLPANYLSSVKGKIEIEEVELSGDKHLHADLCNPHEKTVYGDTRSKGSSHRIRISKRLLELARTHRKVQECSHGSFERMLVATLIHELTHVKDHKEKISLTPDFQRIVGVKRVHKNGRKRLLNQNAATSPDAYEFTNLQEALAVNVEYLLLDPEFECRRPATANFLSQALGIKLAGSCEQNNQLLVQSAFLEDNYAHSVSIDPSRVYQIHYLFAGKGKALMSRWGHAMFRLVVCAPHRTRVGPECMEDVSHHLALSYRAYMSDMKINYAKGLNGSYPSQLFVMRFLEVQQEYTKYEARDLYSVPLRMTEEQKKDFLDLTLERFWSYQGKYYFLDNNCGTETQKHLALALGEDEARLIRSITPAKIYKDIVRQGERLSTVNIRELERQEMVEEGIMVEAQQGELEQTYALLKKHLPFKEKKLDKFLKKTKSDERLVAYQEFFGQARLGREEKKAILMRIIYLERYITGRFLMSLPKKILEKFDKDESLRELVMQTQAGIKLLATSPWEVIHAEYGVPTPREFEVQWSTFSQQRTKAVQNSMQQQMQSMQNVLQRDDFKQELRELEIQLAIKNLTNHYLLNIHQM